MSDKENLKKVTNLLKKHAPVIIFKPEQDSRDTVVPYTADSMELPIIKIGLQNISHGLNIADALAVIDDVLKINPTKDVMLWVKDISVLLGDKLSFINEVMARTKDNKHWFVLFTGILPLCRELEDVVENVAWDTECPETTDAGKTYVRPDHCTSKVRAAQALHFRVYNNLLTAAREYLGEDPELMVSLSRKKDAEAVPFMSLIKVTSLAIQTDTPVYFTSNYPIEKHYGLINALLDAWEKPVPVVDTTQVEE